MRKKIIFGSLFAVFLMLMIPSISAIEYTNVEEANELRIIEKLQKIDIIDLKDGIKDVDIDGIVEQLKEKLNDGGPKPQFIFSILFILIAIISTVLAIIFSTIGLIVTKISQIVFQLLSALFTEIGKVILWVLDLIIP